MASFFAGLVAFFKAIPALKDILDRFIAFYVQRELENFKKENAEAIRKAIHEKDQRDIEKALGSKLKGQPTGLGEIVDSLPNVPKH